MAIADADAVIGRQGLRGRRDDGVRVRERGDHELVADQDAGGRGGHDLGEVAEDVDAVFVGPVVAWETRESQGRGFRLGTEICGGGFLLTGLSEASIPLRRARGSG